VRLVGLRETESLSLGSFSGTRIGRGNGRTLGAAAAVALCPLLTRTDWGCKQTPAQCQNDDAYSCSLYRTRSPRRIQSLFKPFPRRVPIISGTGAAVWSKLTLGTSIHFILILELQGHRRVMNLLPLGKNVMRSAVLSVMMPCSSEKHRRFGATSLPAASPYRLRF
jgi:hypothetical protein